MLYSALYISLVKMVVAYFECVPNPSADATLNKYKQVVCHTSDHTTGTPAMALGMIFYVFGFFTLCLWMNIKAPEKFVDKRFRARCKFLVNRWRADVWYWGSVYMVRNLVLALIAVVSATPRRSCAFSWISKAHNNAPSWSVLAASLAYFALLSVSIVGRFVASFP